MSNFSFSHSVFQRLVLQIHINQGLFAKGLKRVLEDLGESGNPCVSSPCKQLLWHNNRYPIKRRSDALQGEIPFYAAAKVLANTQPYWRKTFAAQEEGPYEKNLNLHAHKMHFLYFLYPNASSNCFELYSELLMTRKSFKVLEIFVQNFGLPFMMTRFFCSKSRFFFVKLFGSWLIVPRGIHRVCVWHIAFRHEFFV